MRQRDLYRLGARRLYAVRRADGRWFAEHRCVGFIFVVDGRWLKGPERCSKYTKTLAESVARERGGEVVSCH